MKKILFLMLLSCITSSLYSQSPAIKEKLKTLMKDEPKVKDYTLTDANVFYVSVLDDGNNRNGYANYIYYLLKEEGIKVYKVVIVKLGSQKDPKRDNAYGVFLGQYSE